VEINPRTTAKDLVKMLEETGTKVSISTVKQVIYQHNLERPLSQEEATAPKRRKKYTTICNCTWRTKMGLFGEMSSGLMKQKI
jgi:hypothetical protein